MRRVFLLLFAFGMLLSSASANAQEIELKHSYDFEDGTAADVIGGANGTLVGGTIKNGVYTASESGEYIELPGSQIAINTYSEITVEAYVSTVSGANTGYTMLFYFGDTSDDGKGTYSFFGSIARGDDVSKAALATVGESPWSYESGPTGTEYDDGNMHHMVVTVNATEVSMYLDGVLAGTETLSEVNSIDLISNNLAYLCKGGYSDDPTWIGSIIEYNIYSGIMDASTVANRYLNFPLETSTTLDTLYANVGTLTPEFNPYTTDYELTVPYGTTSISLEAPSSVIGNVVSMNDGTNDLDAENISFDENGVLVEIIVESLDGSERTYYVDIFVGDPEASAILSDITLSTGNLLSEVNISDTAYTAIVPYGTTTVDVTAVPAASNATVVGDGTLTLTDGVAETTITITSNDGSDIRTYTLSVHETDVAVGNSYYIQQEVSGLVIGENTSTNGVVLYQPLNNATNQLFELVESGVDGQYYLKNQNEHYITLSASNTWSMLMTDQLSEDLDSCRFVVDEYEPGRFHIQSVARALTSDVYLATDGTTAGSAVYCDKGESNENGVWNIKFAEDVVDPYDTYLAELTASTGVLSPEFDPFTTAYTLVLPTGTNSVEIAATANDASSVVTGTGSISLNGLEGTITITVTATDPSYYKEYTIHYLVNSDLELKHQYTFANGTAQDLVGGAHGTVVGGTIDEGVYLADTLGYHIELPGETIAINTYPSFTMEAYIMDDPNTVNESTATMLASFGDTQDGWMGVDYYFLSVKSRAAITVGEYSTPWNDEIGVDGANLHDDGMAHHVVGVVASDSMSFYLDGMIVGSTPLSGDNFIQGLSNAKALLAASVYSGDNTWLGAIYEFNIYSGVMDAQTVATRSQGFPIETTASDATLASISLGDSTLTDFVPTTLDYLIYVPEGSDVPEITPTVKIEGATVSTTKAASLADSTTLKVTSLDQNYSVTYTFKFTTSTSVKTPEVANVSVYPTFTDGSFTVETEGGASTVSVYDLSGSLVKQQSFTSNVQNITVKDAGMYIMKVENQGASKVFKVFKTK